MIIHGEGWERVYCLRGKKAFAISPQMEIIGDTVGVSTAEIQHAKDAWRVSDLIISCDYFAHGRTGDKK